MHFQLLIILIHDNLRQIDVRGNSHQKTVKNEQSVVGWPV